MIEAYIELGFDHILDPKGYDHILFVVAFCAVYLIRDWKKVLILVTAFTIGHSLTLALSSLRLVDISSDLVETLIPVTIILTCAFNVWKAWHSNEELLHRAGIEPLDQYTANVNTANEERVMINYLIALSFGLIHGLGFSNFFKAMLGRDESIVTPLLSFNVGVELGQIIIVMGTLLVSYILVDIIRVRRRYYTIALSCIIGTWAVYLMV